jgi:hypothetical protein
MRSRINVNSLIPPGIFRCIFSKVLRLETMLLSSVLRDDYEAKISRKITCLWVVGFQSPIHIFISYIRMGVGKPSFLSGVQQGLYPRPERAC